MTTAQILAQHDATVERVLQDGPRFFAAIVYHNGKRSFYKGLHESAKSHQHSHYWIKNLTREIMFLDWFQSSGSVRTPQVYVHGYEPIPWYIREDARGNVQSNRGSTFIFKPSFFREHSLAFADFLHYLQKQTTVMPAQLASLTNAENVLHHDSFLQQLDRLSAREKKFLTPNLIGALREYYLAEKDFYSQEQNVLVHREPYPSNIFGHRSGQYMVIDWENIEKRDQARDISNLWIRGFEHPAWQEQLLGQFLDQSTNRKTFWRLFRFNIMLQQVGNLVHFMVFAKGPERNRKDKFLPFAKTSLERVAAGEDFL